MIHRSDLSDEDVLKYYDNLAQEESEALKIEERNMNLKDAVDKAMYEVHIVGKQRCDIEIEGYKITAYRIENQKLVRIDIRSVKK